MDNPIQRKPNTMSGPLGRRPMTPPQGPRPPMPQPAGAMAMTPKEIAGILRRHIWMIIILTVLGLIVGGGSWFLCDRYLPKYTSMQPIDVDSPIVEDPLDPYRTQQVQKDLYYSFRFTKASLIDQDFMLNRLLDNSEKIKTTDWYKRNAELNADGEIIGGRDKARREAFDDLKKNLKTSAPRDYNYIVVSMSCSKPDDAQTIVEEMVRIFLQQQKTLAQSGLTEELAQLNEQRNEIERDLDTIENELKSLTDGIGTRFTARLNLGGNQGFRDYMEERLATLEEESTAAEREKARLEILIAQLQYRAEAYTSDEYSQEQVENDPVARQMRSNIAALEPSLDRQLARFGEDHRLVKETRAALQQMRDQLAERQSEIRAILNNSNLIQAREELARRTKELETATQQLTVAKAEYRDIDRLRTRYDRLEQMRQDTIDRRDEINTLREKKRAQHDNPKLSKLSSPYTATLPREKSFPKPIIFLPGGFMLGLLAGLGLAFLIELSNDRLRTPSDVMRHVKAPLMGMVCHIDDDEDIEGVDLYHVVRQAPYSIMSECYRQLRTNLRLAGANRETMKAVFVTSSKAGDGKTTVAVNLAATLLAEGHRVLLIDANFRRPTSPRLFPRTHQNGSANHPDYGLSNYLMDQCESESQIIRDGGIEGLAIIDSGPLPANPSELFAGQRMKQLLEHCKSEYDHVIIDGPAMLVSDSKTLASQADGTIVVFNAMTTHRGAAIRILRELNEINAPVVGSILMAVKSRKGGYFREVYRSYQEYQRIHVEQPAV